MIKKVKSKKNIENSIRFCFNQDQDIINFIENIPSNTVIAEVVVVCIEVFILHVAVLCI